MASFEMIKYHDQIYPLTVPLRIEEIAAHFDVTDINGNLEYSLHTEYSYGKRKWNSPLMEKYGELRSAQKDGVPQLWKSMSWASQFADFICDLLQGQKQPKVIELHPPFHDYVDLAGFVNNYAVFEDKIKTLYPNVEILIENRSGTVYRGGKFILSKLEDFYQLADMTESKGLCLKIAYDVPQIYTAHNAKSKKDYIRLLTETKGICDFIGGVHLWGKRLSASGRKVSHCGDLNSYFGDIDTKNEFLKAFYDCFDDGVIRKMVLEVNTGNDDLNSIVTDLQSVGIDFV